MPIKGTLHSTPPGSTEQQIENMMDHTAYLEEIEEPR